MYVRFLLLLSVPTVVLREPNFAGVYGGKESMETFSGCSPRWAAFGAVRPRLVRQQGWPGGVQYGSPDGV